MNLKRGAIFIGVTFALMVPYLGFALYEIMRFPAGQVPMWVLNTLMVWFVANIVTLMLVAKRLRRMQALKPKKNSLAYSIAQIFSAYLLVVWSCFFVYGLKETIIGAVPLEQRDSGRGIFVVLYR